MKVLRHNRRMASTLALALSNVALNTKLAQVITEMSENGSNIAPPDGTSASHPVRFIQRQAREYYSAIRCIRLHAASMSSDPLQLILLVQVRLYTSHS